MCDVKVADKLNKNKQQWCFHWNEYLEIAESFAKSGKKISIG